MIAYTFFFISRPSISSSSSSSSSTTKQQLSHLVWKKILSLSSSIIDHDDVLFGSSSDEVVVGPSSSTSSSSVEESSLFQTGVTFDRNITQFPNDGATLTLNFYRNKTTPPLPLPPRKYHEYDTYDSTYHENDNDDDLEDVCTSHDKYGDNICHYNWDDNVIAKYSIESKNVTFTKHDYVVGNFTIDNRLPYTFTCKVCGEDCILKVPIIDFEYTLSMPNCPVKPKRRSHTLFYQLWKSSPTHGFVTTSINGIVTIIKSTKTKTITETMTSRGDSTKIPVEGEQEEGNFHNVTIAQINIQVNVR